MWCPELAPGWDIVVVFVDPELASGWETVVVDDRRLAPGLEVLWYPELASGWENDDDDDDVRRLAPGLERKCPRQRVLTLGPVVQFGPGAVLLPD